MDDLKEKRGYWKLKEEALDGTTSRTDFGRGYGTVARQTRSLRINKTGRTEKNSGPKFVFAHTSGVLRSTHYRSLKQKQDALAFRLQSD